MASRFVLVSLVLLVIVILVHAKEKPVPGVLTNIEPGMVEVKTSKKKTQTVLLNSETACEKYYIYPRRAGDRHADVPSLKIGTHVQIDLRSDNPMIARKVWIVIR